MQCLRKIGARHGMAEVAVGIAPLSMYHHDRALDALLALVKPVTCIDLRMRLAPGKLYRLPAIRESLKARRCRLCDTCEGGDEHERRACGHDVSVH